MVPGVVPGSTFCFFYNVNLITNHESDSFCKFPCLSASLTTPCSSSYIRVTRWRFGVSKCLVNRNLHLEIHSCPATHVCIELEAFTDPDSNPC